MELVGTLFTGLVTAGKTALGIGAAGGAAAPSAGTLFSLKSIAGVAGAVAQIGSGYAAYQSGKAEQAERDYQSREEYVTAKETSAALKSELAATIGNQAVAFAAGGVNLGSVSVQQAKQQAIDDAEYELSMASSGALARSLAQRRAGRAARARGQAALGASFFGAAKTLASGALDRAQIGPVYSDPWAGAR